MSVEDSRTIVKGIIRPPGIDVEVDITDRVSGESSDVVLETFEFQYDTPDIGSGIPFLVMKKGDWITEMWIDRLELWAGPDLGVPTVYIGGAALEQYQYYATQRLDVFASTDHGATHTPSSFETSLIFIEDEQLILHVAYDDSGVQNPGTPVAGHAKLTIQYTKNRV
jgi:hypothetical protein